LEHLKKSGNESVSFEPQFASVADSGDLAYTYGAYTMQPGDKKGYYAHFWKREKNGDWKLVIDVTNPDGYAKEYLPKAREIIKAHGGKLVAAAGAAATGPQVVAVDGAPPKRVVIYVYPNLEALQAWRNDPAYVKVRAVGEKYATYHTFAVEGPVAK